MACILPAMAPVGLEAAFWPYDHGPDVDSSRVVAESIVFWVLFAVGCLCAELFFRRSSRFPKIAIVWMGLICLAQGLSASIDGQWRWHGTWPDPVQSSPLLLWCACWTLYLMFSSRSRRTFDEASPSLHPHRYKWLAVVDHGPQDWRHGVWWLIGSLAVAGSSHLFTALEYAEGAFETVAPYTDPPPDPGTAGVLLKLLADTAPGRIFASQVLLGISVCGLLTALVAGGLFVRRSRWFPLALMVVLALSIAAPASNLLIDPAWLMLDGPDEDRNLRIASLRAALVPGILVFGRHARRTFDR